MGGRRRLSLNKATTMNRNDEHMDCGSTGNGLRRMKPPADHRDWPVYADWLEERGEASAPWRLFEPPHGDGDGDGNGSGDGHGYGDGDGYGYGDGGVGYGKFKSTQEGERMPIVGKRMMIFCGLAFTFVGDVVEQTGPFSFRIDDASMIVRTGGTPWDELASGKGRDSASFREYGTIHVGPQFSFSCEWAGDLP